MSAFWQTAAHAVAKKPERGAFATPKMVCLGHHGLRQLSACGLLRERRGSCKRHGRTCATFINPSPSQPTFAEGVLLSLAILYSSKFADALYVWQRRVLQYTSEFGSDGPGRKIAGPLPTGSGRQALSSTSSRAC